MNAQLSPIVSEFETETQALSYDRWLCAKVEASLANPGPGTAHDEVMARIDAIIEEAERKQRARLMLPVV
jgi:hypothetical protein